MRVKFKNAYRLSKHTQPAEGLSVQTQLILVTLSWLKLGVSFFWSLGSCPLLQWGVEYVDQPQEGELGFSGSRKLLKRNLISWNF